MAVLDPLHPLQSAIIEVLSGAREITAAELLLKLRSGHGLEASRQNVYRTIGQLLERQVLVRSKGRLSLNLMWVTHLERLSETIREHYLDEGNQFQDLPRKEGEVRKFKAHSLLELDPVWNHALLELARVNSGQLFYAYNAHAWYPVGMEQTELAMFRGLLQHGVSCRMLYGDNTFLDSYGLRKALLAGVDAKAVPHQELPPPFRPHDHIVWAAGGHVIECLLPEVLSRHFLFFFSVVQGIENFDSQLFADVFRLRAACSLIVRKASAEADEWRERIDALFQLGPRNFAQKAASRSV